MVRDCRGKEEYCTGSHGPQQTIVLEKDREEKEENEKDEEEKENNVTAKG